MLGVVSSFVSFYHVSLHLVLFHRFHSGFYGLPVGGAKQAMSQSEGKCGLIESIILTGHGAETNSQLKDMQYTVSIRLVGVTLPPRESRPLCTNDWGVIHLILLIPD